MGLLLVLPPFWAALVGVLAVAVVHEEAPRDDGTIFADFRRAFGGPMNGVYDVLAFVLGAVGIGVLWKWLR